MKSPEEVYKAYLNRHELVSGGSVAANWTPDGAGYWFVEGAPENTSIVRVDVATGKSAPLFDVAKVRAALAAATGTEPPHRGLPFETFTTAADGRVSFVYNGTRWRMDPATVKLERAGSADSFSSALGWTSDSDPVARRWRRYDYLSANMDVPEQLSPNREWFAGVRNHNIVLRDTHAKDARERQLTFDGTAERFWDIEGERFKFSSGKRVTFRSVNPWSPDSLTLLAYRRDITGVFRMPRVSWLKPFEEVEFLPYHKVGSKLDRVEPVFVDARSGRQTPVQLTDVDDRFIQLLGWHPAGLEALLVIYTRDFKRVDIVAAHRETGAVRELFSETSPTFVKIQHDAMFSGEHGFSMLPDGSRFLWQSTRDGWNHLYHYDMEGQLIRQLTRGEWPVHEVAHIGADGFIYLTACVDLARPYDLHVCRVPLKGGDVQQLTREKGIHAPTFAPSGLAFLDMHSAADRPTRTDLLKADGTRLRVLSEMDISRLEAVGYRPPEEFTVKALDGKTDLWGVMYKPFNFDAAKSYPVIEYIYGGMQVVEAARFFAIDKTMMMAVKMPWALAQLGYIVVCLDARGTPGRSKAFHDAVYANWKVVIEDHQAAMQQLFKRHRFMDSNRVGVTGHSWGGYFSTAALVQAPETYHAAVSYAPAYDVWDALYYEPYLGQPLQGRAAYEAADILKQADRIKGRLMFLSGTSDYFIINTTMKMTSALIEAGIDHEFVVVPQAFHQFVGADERYMLMKMTNWFDRHVKHREL